MLHIVQLEEIDDHLRRLPSVIALYRERDSRFLDEVDRWLTRVEEILQNNRLPIAGIVASSRASMLMARDGVFTGECEATRRVSARRRQDAVASHVLAAVAETVNGAVQADRLRMEEASRIALHAITVARAAGLLQGREIQSSDAEFAKWLLQTLKNSEATLQAAVQLEGLIGPVDATIILDRQLAYGVFSRD